MTTLSNNVMSQSDSDSIKNMSNRERDLMFGLIQTNFNGVLTPEYRRDKLSRRTYEKWIRKGWYEVGISIFFGWLTDKGKMVVRILQQRGVEK